MVQAIRHPGFAVVDILQPCVSFNHLNTYPWYRQRITPVASLPGYDPADREKALSLASLWGDKIPLGVFFTEVRPTFADSLPQLAGPPLAAQPLDNISIAALMEEMA